MIKLSGSAALSISSGFKILGSRFRVLIHRFLRLRGCSALSTEHFAFGICNRNFRHKGIKAQQQYWSVLTVWISINSIDRYIQYLSQAAEIIAGYPLIPCRRAGTDFRFQNADEFTPPRSLFGQ